MGDGTKENPYTREDVLKRIEENGGKTVRLDLSRATFVEAIDLSGLDLHGIILKEAKFPTSFKHEIVEGADLRGSHLEKADLTKAHLERAELHETYLEGANLRDAHLEDALLWDTHLEGANLMRTKFSPDVNLEDVDWGNYILGEEKDGYFDAAVDTYRRLKAWYSQSGYGDTAGKFYYREKEAGRKGANRWNDRAAGWLTWALFGHGEEWKRILFWIAGFILFFALIYLAIGTFIPNLGTLTPNTFLHSLYYSAVSFTALGYGSWAPQPTGWIKGIGAFESLVGISMVALLLVTFFRKWTR